VPVTVWAGLPAVAGLPSCGWYASPQAATQIITTFSRPADLVAVPDGQATVIAAAAAAGRRVLGLPPAALLAAGRPAAGRAALAVTRSGCGDPGCCGGTGPQVLYAACQRVLRPGGVLAVLTASPAAAGRLHDLPGQVVTQARAAGLVYAQHIVVLHAAIRGGQLIPDPATAVAGLPAARQAHSDLLVFLRPGSRT
jgi:hypothetical protein